MTANDIPKPPVANTTAERLLDQQTDLTADERHAQLEAASSTLRGCLDPSANGPHAEAHLVVGEVQSGKTLAFTTLMALAHDAGFRLIVVLAGTKKNLMSQTVQRLRADLLKGDGGLNLWSRLENPTVENERELRTALGNPESGNATIVCFVLKEQSRLAAMAGLLDEVGKRIDLSTIPALIIDDEADQASPNRKVRIGEESTIYSAIARMRAALPRHDFLMYTATPQAPLLLEIGDTLSPSSITVLTAGDQYVGGNDLFIDRATDYVRRIGDGEVVTALDPDSVDPPPSLRRAVATFLLALVVAQRRKDPRPLTMLVHPAVGRNVHANHHNWVASIVDGLVEPLRSPADAMTRQDALAGVLGDAYADLATTVDDLPALESLASDLPRYAARVAIRLVNLDAISEIGTDDWDDHPGWIVIGAAKLDRGFTVKNLAVTYMPRGRGGGNVDTIQQRGRFFGYKRRYLDLCRGWFSDETRNVFERYVEHEQAMLGSLRRVQGHPSPLREWRRIFLLEPGLSPTRKEVVSRDLDRVRAFDSEGWCAQRLLHSEAAATANRELAHERIAGLSGLEPNALDHRDSPHQQTSLHISDALSLLDDWSVLGADGARFLGAALVLGVLRDTREAERVNVLIMDGLDASTGLPRTRSRKPRAGGPPFVVNVFQGRGRSKDRYPGDRAFGSDDRPTLAIFNIDLANGPTDPTGSAPAIALHVPGRARTLVLDH